MRTKYEQYFERTKMKTENDMVNSSDAEKLHNTLSTAPSLPLHEIPYPCDS